MLILMNINIMVFHNYQTFPPQVTIIKPLNKSAETDKILQKHISDCGTSRTIKKILTTLFHAISIKTCKHCCKKNNLIK